MQDESRPIGLNTFANTWDKLASKRTKNQKRQIKLGAEKNENLRSILIGKVFPLMFIGLVCCCCGFAYSFAALVLIFYFFEFSSYIYIYVAFCFFWSYSCRISLNKTLPAATPLPSRTGDELVVEFNSCSSTPVSYNLCHDPHLEPRKAVGGCRLHKTLSSEQKATATKKK